jgi:hypothetical protein
MAGAADRAKDSARAAAMKAAGVKRTITLCPVCHKKVNLAIIYNHIVTCKG